MSGQGYHLAVTKAQGIELLSCQEELDVLDRVNDFMELLRGSKPEFIHGGDKDWNVLLLCLTDGTYAPRGGTYPLNQCFFGGELLVSKGSIINLVMPEVARDIASSLSRLGEEWFRKRYSALFAKDYQEGIPEWVYEKYYDMMQNFRAYYHGVVEAGMGVVFYTDDCLSYFFRLENHLPHRGY